MTKPRLTTAEEVLNEFKPRGILTEVIGSLDKEIFRIAEIENCSSGDLVFLNSDENLAYVEQGKPAVVVTTEKLKSLFTPGGDVTVFTARNLPLAHAQIKTHYSARDFSLGWEKRHPSAVIEESAILDPSVVVEPKAVIGKNVRIGKNTRIMAGVVVEHDVEIGENTIIHPTAVIGYRCRIGNEVVIGSGTIIGSSGFGYAQDDQGKSFAIPQTGIVVIEDRVSIGANNCIDRAAYGQTKIGAGTKIDNLGHFAHGVQIGEDCLLTAMFCVAGSTKIGKRMMASGMTGIGDHVEICDDVMLVHKATVLTDIEERGAYAGTPHQPLKPYMRNVAALRELAEMKKRVRALEKKLGIESDSSQS